MSNELLVSANLYFKKSGAGVSDAVRKAITVAGDACSSEYQSIPTSNTAITIPAAITTVGYVLITNLSTANYVQIGLTGSYTIKLLPGHFALFPPAGTLYALADTAACLIKKTIIEI